MTSTYPKGGKVKRRGVKRAVSEVVEGPLQFKRAKLGDSEETQFDRRMNYYGKKSRPGSKELLY